MGRRWPTVCLVLAVLTSKVRGDEDRWSRPATPERRQGDWVPLSCANCRPALDQSVQGSSNLPSVLTPPPRAEEARILQPPPPPDGLFQQAASGFLQAFTQQQAPRKHQQFLKETTAQSIIRPQAQFLKANSPLNSKPSQPFLQEPSQDFLPPQEPRQNRQPQLLQYTQQFVSDQPYLNQPLLLGPQFLANPFFPQTSIPPQNIQPLSSVQLQPQNPLSPNVFPNNNGNFEVSPDRPLFAQQITAGVQQLPVDPLPQQLSQTAAPLQYSVNETDSQRDDGEKEEVQLLYVPVETLNQRARGKPKSLPSNQQDISTQQVVGEDSNRHTGNNFEFSTSQPLLKDQSNYNIQTQTSKPQYNIKQGNQFQQQLPLDDQEKFNTQTHSIRQQFIKQNEQLQQQPNFRDAGSLKLEAQNTKQQYNFKTNEQQPQSHLQPDLSSLNSQINFQPNVQFHQQTAFDESQGRFPVQAHNTRQEFDHSNQPQQDQTNFQRQNFNHQFRVQQEGLAGNTFRQQFPSSEQQFISQSNAQQLRINQNSPFQQQPDVNQQVFSNFRNQPYINQPIKFEQTLQSQQEQRQPQVQQTHLQQYDLPEDKQKAVKFDQTLQSQQEQLQRQHQVQQTHLQQFDLPEDKQKPVSHVSQTVVPETVTSEEIKEERFKSPQQDSRNLQQVPSNQFLRQNQQDYQRSPSADTNQSPTQSIDSAQSHNEYLYNQQRKLNQQQYSDVTLPNQFHVGKQQISTLAPASTTIAPSRTTLAPNQPPLSVYMETTEESKVNDVLRLLKNAKTIQVLDTVGPESPQVFVGPSNLKAPTGYIKFELPYLNSLDSNRVERKVDKLPFFVAPLNFNPPQGYSKIPFPAPHIGSVVVSNVTVLRTALHEKPYFNEPLPISTTDSYSSQFTLPDNISPISPQLPSLINSLRDEIYSPSPTTSIPSTSTESTTIPYTTPTYRGRGSTRGSHRGSSSYTTSTTKRPQSQPRTRRPYSRRQPVTTTTTTEEPTPEVPIQHNSTPQSEQLAFNSEVYNVQNTAAPNNLHSNIQQNNPDAYYNEQFVANSFNPNQFSTQQSVNQLLNQHQQQFTENSQSEQYHQNSQLVQNDHTTEPVAQSVSFPSVTNSNVQQNDYTLKNQRNSGSRRDPSKHHQQKFRGRQRLTTTEIYEQPPQQTNNQFYPQEGSNVNFNNLQSSSEAHNQQKLVENTHFQANTPQNLYNIQTERVDVGFQTTERQRHGFSEEQNSQEAFNKDQYNSHLNQFEQPPLTQSSESSQPVFQDQEPKSQEQFSQQNINTQQGQVTHGFNQPIASQNSFQPQYNTNQFHQLNSHRDNLQPVNSQESPNQYNSFEDSKTVPVQSKNNYFDQQRHHESHTQNQQVYNDQQVFLGSQEQTKDFSSIEASNHGHHISNSGQLEHVTTSTPQEVYLQTTETGPLQLQVEDEPQLQQFNQQRLKYNRPSSRTQTTENTSNEELKRNQQHIQTIPDITDATSDDVTTKASLVRVRGRVRSRQRGGSVRQSTTTEEPNYPTAFLNRQKQNQDSGESQEYSKGKRVNYNARQTYNSQKSSNKDVDQEQSSLENYSSTERQVNSDSTMELTDTSTTTTEASTNKPSRKYQHILNRNKVRRTRPTNSPSTSGSSGTTRFLLPTTQPPVTRLPSSTRGRIRRPVNTKPITSTTDYPEVKTSWKERENFAPSAGSNEILEPLYQTKDNHEQSFGFQHNSVPHTALLKTTQKPAITSDDNDFWNQAVTIQQSTSFDFKPDAVTPSSFKDSEDSDGTFSPIWNGQVELQDGNYFNAYNQRQIAKHDQTPFSSDQQKIVYKDIKSRRPIGKENQYTEKTYEEETQITNNEDENSHKVYPVYRETSRPSETTDQDSLVVEDQYNTDKKVIHEKDNIDSSELHLKNYGSQEKNSEEDSELKNGALKRKIIATHPGKKGGRRRGSWVRVRVRKPQDVFETAESQNLARLSENSIQGVTKTTTEKPVWTPEPTTESAHTTLPEEASEPSNTITFEDALKDMLKEFITNPEEDEHEETETEASTEWPNLSSTKNTTEETKGKEELIVQNEERNEKEMFPSESTYNEELSKSNIGSDESIKQQNSEVGKTTIPEVTTEIFTPDLTTLLQLVDNAETTLEPEVTTTPNELYKQPLSRVLGTSTTTEISLETEICYRGRCVKTKKADTDSDLLTME